MKNFRWVLSGFVLGLLIAISPSCGPARKCDSTNCATGCCDANGMCQGGLSPTACGSNARQCTPCASNQYCHLGQCLTSGSGGGGGSGGGAGGGGGGAGGGGGSSCGPSSCSTGCCSSLGECITTINNTNCGANGSLCQTCSGSQQCTSGQCIDTSCTGCIQGGSCQPGNSTTACGIGGVTCAVCQGGATCSGGQCTGGACNSSNCPSGCCNGTACIPYTSQSDTQCGTFGATCISCGSGYVCQNGTCTGACGPSNCTGCCNGNICVPTSQQTNSSCGQGGAACLPCGSGQTCTGGQCTGTGTCATLTFNALAQVAGYDPTDNLTYGYHGSNTSYPMDMIEVTVWHGRTGPSIPGSQTFSTSTTTTNCKFCVAYFTGCQQDGSCTGGWFAQGGSVNVSEATAVETSGQLTATLANVRLVQWDFVNDAPVTGGSCFTLPAHSVSISWAP